MHDKAGRGNRVPPFLLDVDQFGLRP